LVSIKEGQQGEKIEVLKRDQKNKVQRIEKRSEENRKEEKRKEYRRKREDPEGQQKKELILNLCDDILFVALHSDPRQPLA
jgi:hypothetical protein